MKQWSLLLIGIMFFSLCISESPGSSTIPPTTTPELTEPPTTPPPTTTLAPDNPPIISGYNTDVIEKQVGNYRLTFSNQPMQIELSVSATDDKGITSVYAELDGQTIELEKDGSTYKALLDLEWFTKYDGKIFVEDTKGQTTEKEFTINKTAADIIRVDWVGPNADKYDNGYSTPWIEDDMHTMTEQQFNDLQEDALKNPMHYKKGATIFNQDEDKYFTLDKGALEIVKDVDAKLPDNPTALEIAEALQEEVKSKYFTSCAGNTTLICPGLNYLFEKHGLNARAMPMASALGKSVNRINHVDTIFRDFDKGEAYYMTPSNIYIYGKGPVFEGEWDKYTAVVGEVDDCIKKAGARSFKEEGVLGELISLVDMRVGYSRIDKKTSSGYPDYSIFNKLTLPLGFAKMLAHHEVDSGPDDTILMEAIKSYMLWNELKDGSGQKAVMLGLTKDFLTEDSEIFGIIKQDKDLSLIKLLEDELEA
ncbi:MAG: hypothetical protein KAT49_03245 [Methanomicrobia archaeon]|nr:hypothetical protein [Methanomicrobia archaeon]